jgi:leucyl aminopeptidase (aminopeptidase T)
MSKMLEGARKAIKTCLNVKKGENLLIVTDPPKIKIAEALMKAGLEVGAKPVLVCMQVRSRDGEEPPDRVAKAMAAADVVVAPTIYSLTHTQARRKACKAGARIATMPGITEKQMSGGAMLADYQAVKRLSERIKKLLDLASKAVIKTGAGTELYLDLRGRKAHADTGILHEPGEFGNLPAGEAFIAPVEGKAEGKVVIDGPMIGKRGEIEMIIKKGFVSKLCGRNSAALKRILRRVGKKAYNLAEFGIGTNPTAALTNSVLESEKVFGTCHVALGDNSTFGGKVKAGVHLDGIISRPTIELDGKIIMDNGNPKFR